VESNDDLQLANAYQKQIQCSTYQFESSANEESRLRNNSKIHHIVRINRIQSYPLHSAHTTINREIDIKMADVKKMKGTD